MSNSLELNKIAAAVLCAGIIYMGSDFVSDILYESEELEQNAYVVDLGSEEAAPVVAAAAPASIEPVGPLLAMADPDEGGKVFRKCAACHSLDEGGPNKVGPNLWGIVNRSIASHEGFSYSSSLKDMSEEIWDYESLNEFLHKPKQYAPGTKMSFPGLKKVSDRANLIAYLRSHASTPAALP